MIDENFQWKSSCQNLLASAETYSTFMVLQVRKRGEYSVVSGLALQSVNNKISKGIDISRNSTNRVPLFSGCEHRSLKYLT